MKSTIILVLFVLLYSFLSCFFNVGIWIPQAEDEEILDEKKGIDEEINLEKVGTVYELKGENVKVNEETGLHYVDNIIIIFFEETAKEEEKREVINFLSGTIVGKMPVINQYQIKIEAHNYDELKTLCNSVQMYDCVKSAYIDLAVKLQEDVVPQDPWKKLFFFLGEEWDENNPDGSNWWQEAINAPSAWEYNSYFENIKIGIIDSGFDTSHEDLNGRIKDISENNDAGKNHGTHVAGIIGATPNNYCGITGIVWNSELYTSDWELTKEQKKSGGYSELEWEPLTKIHNEVYNLIAVKNVKVVNLSLGMSGELDKESQTIELVDEQGKIASEYLVRLLEKGYDFVIVQSAGNGDKDGDSIDAKYNGLYCSITNENCVTTDCVAAEDVVDRVIVVGAAQNDGKEMYTQASFSNAGANVDLCAPGKAIYSAVPGGYDFMSGTSMAAPIVTGVTALVWSVDMGLTGDEVKEIVCDKANTKYEVNDNASESHPLVNEYCMVNAQLAVEASLKQKHEKSSHNLGENPIASSDEMNAESIQYAGKVLKPEDVVLKMYDALRKGEYETAVECLDPETEQRVDFWGGLATSIVNLCTVKNASWGNLLLEAVGTTDVEVIECSSYNFTCDSSENIFNELLMQVPGMKKIICTEADVFIKYRYKYDEQCYILVETYHVKRYKGAGWRIEQ